MKLVTPCMDGYMCKTTIMVHSGDHDGVGMNITQKSASFSPHDDGAVMVKTKQALRSTQDAFKTLLQNFQFFYSMGSSTDLLSN